MTWPAAAMAGFFRVKHGYAFKGEFFDSDGPYVLLTPGSFNEEGGFRDQLEKTKFYTGDVPDGYILEEGDLLVAMTEQAPGLLGSSAWIPEGARFLHNQRLGRIVDLDSEKLSKRFLYYLFNTRDVRQQIAATATGGKVRHTAPERIGKVTFKLPPRDVQDRIAEALTTYDSLMDNNRRRTELLEEGARHLYHEWFVRLRFPGSEHARLVKGVPAGWNHSTLGELVAVRKGKNITQATVREGDVPVVAGGLEPAYRHDEANASGPVVTISASGANAGFVNLYLEDIWASDCSVIDSAATPHVYFMYCLLGARQREVFGLQKGAAQPHVYPKDLMRLEVLRPPETLLRQFTESIESSFALIGNLRKQNTALKLCREMLLPRLVSGDVTV